MKRLNNRPTVNLSQIAFSVYKKVIPNKQYGWFSKFVSEQLIEHYGKSFEKKIIVERLVQVQDERDKLEKEIEKLGKRLEKINRR